MFSIVIPVYNKEYSIDKTLSSIAQQSLNEYEIILVNDGSTDGSLSEIKKFLQENKHLDVTLIDQLNQGVSVARNIGIQKSKYDLICFLDADDNWEPNYLELYKKYIYKYPNASAWISSYKVNQLYSIEYEKEGYIDNFFKISSRKTILHTSAVCVKKSMLMNIGGFPEGKKVGEDLYVWARIAENYKLCYIPYNLVNVIQADDFSRSGRDLVNPYILEYYVVNKQSLKNKNLKKYLMYIYFVHLTDVINKKNYSAIYGRWRIGIKLFPFFSILMIIPAFFPFSLLKKIKNIL